MNHVTGAFVRSTPRSGRAWLQVGIAAVGAITILGSLVLFAIVFAVMGRSESGFAEGMAILVFGVSVLMGFVVVAIGLLIPQRGEDGIRFSPGQRKLLAYGAAAPIVSVLLVPIGARFAPPLSEPTISVLVAIVTGVIVSGPLATLSAVVLKVKG